MRKKIIACVIAALCLFIGASPWEGAAATAPEGELPGNGRYIATNSFPRNTVVDIVNIETNKSTRVIVAANLDSPGLLAIVSREAAELIGMRPGSVSRIRMTQPSDPVAYVRFTEGLSSGVPDYDSGDVITEEKYNEDFVNPSVPPSVSTVPPPVPPAVPPFAAAPDVGYPSYMLEPEWSGAGSRRDIVDLPPAYAPSDKRPDTIPPVLPGEPEKIADSKPTDAEITGEVPEETADAGTGKVELKEITPENTAEYFPDDNYEEVAEYSDDEYFDDDFVKEPDAIAEAEDVPEDDYFDGKDDIVEYIIVPTDDRPPSGVYGIDPAFIIPGISSAAKPETAKPETPKKENEKVSVNMPDSSIQRSDKPVSGKYYVQLVAFNTNESVENSISRINQEYKQKFQLFVYKGDDMLYRALLGPLNNQGESAAVLARFKSIGYNDAFVTNGDNLLKIKR